MSEAMYVFIHVESVWGSTPCDKGAKMIVSPHSIVGSIGGGRLEFDAIHRARKWLEHDDGRLQFECEQSLGPELGQCCGGRVLLRFEKSETPLNIRDEQEFHEMPLVAIFGAGHIGNYLRKILMALEFPVQIYDSRPVILGNEKAEYEIAPIAEEKIDALPSGAVVLIMTHDHGLDFLIAAHALERDDWQYLGMIGSQTKAAKFRSQFPQLKDKVQNLHCPIFKSQSQPVGNAKKASSLKEPKAIALEIAASLVQILQESE